MHDTDQLVGPHFSVITYEACTIYNTLTRVLQIALW